MLRKFVQICIIMVCFGLQSQSSDQNNWEGNIKILIETVAMFDIKVYNSTNPEVAVKIKNYTIEDDFLIVSMWERSTGKSEKSKFNLRCLANADLNCETSCTLTLDFDSAGASNMNNAKTRIELSNCEVVSKTNCSRLTWKPEDDSVLKAKQAFQQLVFLNNN
jgi:hypothetical protein